MLLHLITTAHHWTPIPHNVWWRLAYATFRTDRLPGTHLVVGGFAHRIG